MRKDQVCRKRAQDEVIVTFDYDELISKSIRGHIEAKDIAPYENYLYAQTIKRVDHIYLEEIKSGELTGQKLQATVFLNSLKSLEIDTQLKSIVRLGLLYNAQKNGLYHAMGFDDIESWLDSFGINARNGNLSQLLAIAREIIPWAQKHNLSVDGVPIDINWFKRIVGGKCIAVRACMLVALFRRTIKSGPLDTQKEIIVHALKGLANPKLSRAYLQDTFNGYTSEEPIQGEKYTLPDGRKVFIFVAKDPGQEQWIHRKLASTSQIERVYEAIVLDKGSAWLSPQALDHISIQIQVDRTMNNTV